MYLTDTHRELLEEWHYEKNTHIHPSVTTRGSRKRVWWKCKQCNGEWEAYIFNRAKGSGCPFCKKRRLLPDKSLAHLYKEILLEWDYENNAVSPYDYSCGSQQKVWWKCKKCHHHYYARIVHRTKYNSGCPYCAGKKVADYNSLATIFPQLVEEWDYENNQGYTPTDFLPYSHKKVWWVCNKCKIHWKAKISSRSTGSGCPNCRNKTKQDPSL